LALGVPGLCYARGAMCVICVLSCNQLYYIRVIGFIVEGGVLMAVMNVQRVVAAAQQLSPTEQLELIQQLSDLLQRRWAASVREPIGSPDARVPFAPTIRRSAPVTSVRQFAADFWPADETADDIVTYLTQQRVADRERDQGADES
jgi:hypothetical protein